MAAPTFVDQDGLSGATRTTITFDWANIVGEANDDVAIAFLYGEAQADPTSIPTGWTRYHSWDQATGGFKYRAHVYWRRVSGDTGTFSWVFADNVWRSAFVGLWRGLVTSGSPLLPVTPDENIETSQNTEPSHPGITVATANAGLVFATWAFAGGGITTDPTGYTVRGGGTGEIHFWDDLTVTAGATGTIAADLVDPEWCSEIPIELVTELPVTVAITGTATASINEADIVAGGKTIIETLTNGTFKPAAGTAAFSTATAATTTAAPGRTGNGDLTISFPAGYTPIAGDFALIVLYHDQGTGSLPSGGWAQVTGSPWGAGTPRLQAFWKVLVGGESAPVTTISGSGTNISHCAGMMIYTGVGSVGAIGTASEGTGSPMTAAAINTTVNNVIVVAIAGRGDNETSSGQTFGGSGTGVNERLDAGTDQGNDSQVSAADKSFATSGTSSGAFSSTTSATDPWVCVQLELKPSTPFDDARQAIINGLDSAQAEATGWDAVVKAGLAVTTVVRTSNTVVTITLSAFGSYNITAQETITATVPAAALVSGGPVVGTPTFTVATAGTAVTPSPVVVNVRVVAPSVTLSLTVGPAIAQARVVAPTVTLSTTPAPVVVQARVVAPSIALNLAPAPVVAQARVVAPSNSLALTVGPVIVEARVVAPTHAASLTVGPVVVQARVVAPTLSLSLAPAPVVVNAIVVAPTIAVTYHVTPDPVVVAVRVVAPDITNATVVTPDPVVVAVRVVAPTVTLSVTPAPVIAEVSVVAPSVTTGISIQPAPVVVNVRVVAPTVTLALTPAPVAAQVRVVAPTYALNLTPAPTVVQARVVAPHVTLSVTPAPVVAFVRIVAPTVTTAGDVDITVGPVVVVARVIAPTITLTGGVIDGGYFPGRVLQPGQQYGVEPDWMKAFRREQERRRPSRRRQLVARVIKPWVCLNITPEPVFADVILWVEREEEEWILDLV